MAERVAKLAGKTHKDRVNEFNAKLEALSEHHDIPKVSTYTIIYGWTFSLSYLGWTGLKHLGSMDSSFYCTVVHLSILSCISSTL